MTGVVSALILIGAPGSGKSSVLDDLATLLEQEGIAHGAIESEQLARGMPLLEGSAWIEQLAAVLALQRGGGRRLFLIAATAEDAEQLGSIKRAVDGDRTLTACLQAAPDVVAARLELREPDDWPGKGRLIGHARQLAISVPEIAGIDLLIDTTTTTSREAAVIVRDAMRSRGLLG